MWLMVIVSIAVVKESGSHILLFKNKEEDVMIWLVISFTKPHYSPNSMVLP